MENKTEYNSYVYSNTPSPYRTELKVTAIDNINRNYVVEGIRYWEDAKLEVNIIEYGIHFKIDETGFVIGSSGSEYQEECFQEEMEEIEELALKVYLDYLESKKK